jgi:Ca2+-binding RTX toxin-like protein
MANFYADYSFDITNLNLNKLISGFYDSQFYNNTYLNVGAFTYEDTFDVIYYDGAYYAATFGGKGFAFDSAGNVSSGTVTGFLQGFYSGSTLVAWWGIENISYSASLMFSAALTSSTADDYSIISSILANNDTIYLSPSSDVAYGFSGNDNIFGYGGNDLLRGGLGKDILDGGIGVDTADYSDKTTAVKVTLNGSSNVSVYVNGSIEDTIKNIENITGGSGADLLVGDSLANTLRGNSGIDTLKGRLGKDVFYGGLGADSFVFDTALSTSNTDTIKDFQRGVDKLVLDDDIFKVFTSKTKVSTGNFIVGTKALQSDDYLIYNTQNDMLYYDADGSGSRHSMMEIAKIELSGSLSPTHTDFVVVA